MPLPTINNTANPRHAGLHCRINDIYYRLVSLQDQSPLVETAPLQPPRIDTSSNPEDIRPETGTIWSLTDFTGGEGLDFAHRRNQTRDPSTRYWDSSGIDVSPSDPGEATSIRLLNSTTKILTNTGTNRAVIVNDVMYVTAGNDVKTSNNLLAGTPSFSTEDPHAAQGAVTVQDITHLGTDIYVALGSSGIHKRTGSWTHWSDLAAVRVWGMKGRVMASTGPALYDADTAATSTLVHTLDPDYAFTAMAEVGSHMIAAADDGNMYALTLNESSGAIALVARIKVNRSGPITAMASMPEASLVFYATSSDGGTNTAIHRAQVSDNGTLIDAQTIREFEGSTDQTIDAIFVDERAVYFGFANTPGLWRYDLTTGGRSRDMTFTTGTAPDDVQFIASLDDRLFVGVAGSGVWRQSTSYVTSGYLITPLIDHFTSADKAWSGIIVDVEPVTGGTVEVFYSTNPEAINSALHPSWVRIKKVSAGTDDSESVIAARSRFLSIKIVLTASASGTISPSLRSVSTRAYPGRGDIILTLPINTSDQIETPGRSRLTIPGLGRTVYDSLSGIEGSSVLVELLDPPEVIRGVVDSVSSRVPAVTSRGSQTLVSVVKVQGRRVGLVSTSGSFGPLGTYHVMGTLPVMGKSV